jgi:PilZ domain-containing protein
MRQLVPRRYERQRFLGDVLIRSLWEGGSFTANLLDLGRRGAALFTGRFLGVGQPVELALRTGGSVNAPGGPKLVGRVVYARAEPEGNIMGIAFDRVLSTQELNTLETHTAIGRKTH